MCVPGERVASAIMNGRYASMAPPGVRLVDGEVVAAGQVILSAGTDGSPAILMRSAVGAAHHLEELGIPILIDGPVGDRMKEAPLSITISTRRSPKPRR
jgi:choline dehydrogenase